MNLPSLCFLFTNIIPIHFYEQPDSRLPYTFVAIRIALPAQMDEQDRTYATVLGETLLKSGVGTSFKMVQEMSSDRGLPLRCYAMPNSLVIEMGCFSSELEVAERRLLAAISTAKFTRAQVTATLDELSTRRYTYWQRAADPTTHKAAVDMYDLTERYFDWVRPEHMAVCFTGTFTAGEPRRIWEKSTRDWLPPIVPAPLLKAAQPDPFVVNARSLEPVSTISFRAFPTKQEPAITAVACAMLGMGKGSSAHQVLREKYGLSYRQEGYLRPTSKGLAPELSFALKASGQEAQTAEAAKGYLLEAIGGWTQADLDRAKALLGSSFDQTIDLSVWWLRPEGYAESGSPISDALLTTEWAQDFGKPFDPAAFRKAVTAVTLEQAKAAAIDTIQGQQIIVFGRS